MKAKEKEVLKLALETFGADAQIDKAIEEMAELTKALMKHRYLVEFKDGVAVFDDVIDEIADVELMTKQLKYMFDPDRVNDRKKKKIKRLINRIERYHNR